MEIKDLTFSRSTAVSKAEFSYAFSFREDTFNHI